MIRLPISAFIGYRYTGASAKTSFVAFINVFSVVGIGLGIASLITVLSVMNGLEGQLKQRILGIEPHIVVNRNTTIAFKEEVQSHILAAIPYAEREVIVQSRKQLQGSFLQGIVPSKMPSFSIIANNIIEGILSDIQSGSYNIILSKSAASDLAVSVGDSLRIISTTASQYTPLGRIPSQRLVNVAAIFEVGSEVDASVMLIHLDDLARISREKTDDIEQIRLYLQDAFAYQTVGANLTELGLEYTTWREKQGPLFDAVKMEKNMMSLMLALIIAVAAFNIVSALVMVVSEKQADVAILQTQGLLPWQVMQIFIFNGMFNAIKGLFFGVILGIVIVYQLNNFLLLIGINLAFAANGEGLPIDLRWPQVLVISLLSLLLSVLATLFPAYKASKNQPAATLQRE